MKALSSEQPPWDFNDLYFFMKVIEHGGYSSAERALGITKSRLSRRVSDLEAKLGIRLIQRSSRRLSVTPAGALFLQHCKNMCAEAQAGFDAISMLQMSPRGTVRIGCTANVARLLLAPALTEFMERYPDVKVDVVVTGLWIDLYDAAVDLALRVRPEIDEATSVIVKPLLHLQQRLVAAPSLLAKYPDLTSPDDLSALPTLSIPTRDGRFTWTMAGDDGEFCEVHHRPRLLCDDVDLLRQGALAGQGVARLSELLCRQDIASGKLVVVLPEWHPPSHHGYLAFLSRRGLPPATRALVDHLAVSLPSLFGHRAG